LDFELEKNLSHEGPLVDDYFLLYSGKRLIIFRDALAINIDDFRCQTAEDAKKWIQDCADRGLGA
jgi:hypothetical protein